MNNGPQTIVQKYGGATVADPQKIKAVAARLASLHRDGHRVVAVVSAMGKTTNQLIELAQQVSSQPNRRELDMLLTTGERVTMALVTMALHDLGIPAISFTGSQAGILTDESHFNAQIQDVKAFRVEEALQANKVVVLAGFQGVCPSTKEITTLGRGGSDSTAVAMAAYLHADHCEILKEVPAVLSADPQVVKAAKVLPHLNYQQMLDMSFWGAKVLYYRSVELAMEKKVRLYIGPAGEKTEAGSWVDDKPQSSPQSAKILAINSHEKVLEILSEGQDPTATLKNLNSYLHQHEIPTPQILQASLHQGKPRLFITGSTEILRAIEKDLGKSGHFQLGNTKLSSVSGTCFERNAKEIQDSFSKKLQSAYLKIHAEIHGSMTTTYFLQQNDREQAIQALHSLL